MTAAVKTATTATVPEPGHDPADPTKRPAPGPEDEGGHVVAADGSDEGHRFVRTLGPGQHHRHGGHGRPENRRQKAEAKDGASAGRGREQDGPASDRHQGGGDYRWYGAAQGGEGQRHRGHYRQPVPGSEDDSSADGRRRRVAGEPTAHGPDGRHGRHDTYRDEQHHSRRRAR